MNDTQLKERCKCECHLGFPWQEINGECEHCKPMDDTQSNQKNKKLDSKFTIQPKLDDTQQLKDMNVSTKDAQLKEQIDEILHRHEPVLYHGLIRQDLIDLFHTQQAKQLRELKEKLEQLKGGKQRLQKDRFTRLNELKIPAIEGSILWQEMYEWVIDDVLSLIEQMGKED